MSDRSWRRRRPGSGRRRAAGLAGEHPDARLGPQRRPHPGLHALGRLVDNGVGRSSRTARAPEIVAHTSRPASVLITGSRGMRSGAARARTRRQPLREAPRVQVAPVGGRAEQARAPPQPLGDATASSVSVPGGWMISSASEASPRSSAPSRSGWGSARRPAGADGAGAGARGFRLALGPFRASGEQQVGHRGTASRASSRAGRRGARPRAAATAQAGPRLAPRAPLGALARRALAGSGRVARLGRPAARG